MRSGKASSGIWRQRLAVFSVGLSAAIFAAAMMAPSARAMDPRRCAQSLRPARYSMPPRDIRTLRQIKVGTYNLQDFYGEPPHETRFDVRTKDYEKAREIARMLLKHDLDIVVLNEIENRRVLRDFIDLYLENRYVPYIAAGNDPSNHNIAFLVKRDLPFRVDFHSHRDETWDDPRVPDRPQLLFTRDLPMLTLRRADQPHDSKPVLVVLGTHYKSQRKMWDGSSSFSLREAQVRRSADIVQRLQRDQPNLPVVLAGDFNGNVNFAPEFVSLWRVAHFDDAFNLVERVLPRLHRITHTYHPANGRAIPEQMDAILVSPPLRNLVLNAQVARYRDERGHLLPLARTAAERERQPSDHFLTFVTLSVRPLLGAPPLQPNDEASFRPNP